ncbi:Phage phiEco32-like COOH.NH2 ligase-type 2 [Fontibacillus panacisegetis]|uniref:Phage phiEco32-like COOH.NH2 ligase-type 2 n=1 Tax=Fontibacillus panacisegetis TaxID=670482 RepID=A0A1G7GPE4_9BACL|nr:hypothetical protein [Fontibacillus panacisegetis]SDE89976.1 Phage phiEco32-like COOH.NH2 ligase-type 2 [Fontibacillus panacisegetis]
MAQMTNHVLKIQVEQGSFRSRLLRCLETIGGTYRVIQRSGALKQQDNLQSNAIEWIEIGAPLHREDAETRNWIMNSELTQYKGMSVKSIKQRLELAGIYHNTNNQQPDQAWAKNKAAYFRRYKVSVFHLKALRAVPLRTGGKMSSMHEQQPDRQSPLWKRLERTAVKTLYALGLDLGEVLINAGEEGRFIVEEIHVTPDARDDSVVPLFAQAMSSLLDELHTFSVVKPEILLGMDPEFLLFDHGNRKVVPASRYLNRQGEAGCDVLRYRGRKLYPLAELRPAPGREPSEVVLHLLHAFRSAQRAIPDNGLLWQAGGMPQRGFPLGGHVHFSGVPLTGELLRALDNYLALPVAAIEDPGSFRRRPLYGNLGDFREQGYGGFEYRTLPSFLVSPLVTKGVVALARLIVENVGELSLRPLHRDEIYQAFYTGDQKMLRYALPPLINDITSATTYHRYENYISPFLEAVLSGQTWDESADIRRLWKIQNRS